MFSKLNKNAVRQKRHARVRKTITGTAEKPRLNVYRSTSNIYVQLVDDVRRHTLASSSTIAKGVDVQGKSKSDAAKIVGQDIAAKAKALGISSVVFDRGGYLYIGRVKAVADGAREAGLEF